MPETQTPPPTLTTPEGPRPITIEEVHQTIGALYMEIAMLRRENVALKSRLSNGSS